MNPLDPQGILAALAAIGSPVSPSVDPSSVQPGFPHPPDIAGSPSPGTNPDALPPGPSFLSGGDSNDRIAAAAARVLDELNPSPGPTGLTPEQAHDAAVASGFAPQTVGQTPGQIAAGVQMTPDSDQGAGQSEGPDTSVPQQPQGYQPQPFLPGAANNPDIALVNEGIAASNEAGAQTAADRDAANRKLRADTDYATELQKAQINYQHERALAEANANQETTAWLQKYQSLAAQEPNPHRWWDNESGLGKALWLMGLAFSSVHSAITPGAQNVALTMIQQEIDRDVQLQKERLQRSLDALKAEGRAMDQRHQQNLTDLTDDHTMTLGRLQALHQAYLDKAAVPGNAQAALAQAKANTWFAGRVSTLAQARAKQAAEAAEQAANRKLQLTIANLTDARERAIAARHDVTELAGDEIRAGVAAQAAQAKSQGDFLRISPDIGVHLVDDKTGQLVGDGSVSVPKEEHKDLLDSIAKENATYNLLLRTKQDLADTDRLTVAGKLSPQLQQDLAALTLAANNGKVGTGVSDRDLALKLEEFTGVGDSGKVDAIKMGALRDSVVDALDREINDFPQAATNRIGRGRALQPGTHVVWVPPQTLGYDKPYLSTAQVQQDAGLRQAPTPHTVEEYRDAEQSDLPPKVNAAAVKQAKDFFSKASPEVIEQMAAHWTDPQRDLTETKRGYEDFPYDLMHDEATRLAIQSAAQDEEAKAKDEMDALMAEVQYKYDIGSQALLKAGMGRDEAIRAVEQDVRQTAKKDYGRDLTDDDVLKVLQEAAPYLLSQ
jgi:hypothetical protein